MSYITLLNIFLKKISNNFYGITFNVLPVFPLKT